MSENFAMQEKNSKVSSSTDLTDGLNKGSRLFLLYHRKELDLNKMTVFESKILALFDSSSPNLAISFDCSSFLAKNLSNLFIPLLKLHNWYCHNGHPNS